MSGLLGRVEVIDLTRALAGPYCTVMLGDMGAEVIKVEQPGSGDESRGWGPPFIEGESSYFMTINRNKRSMTLNLKHEEGQEILRKLVRRADVLVENFRPGTMERLGLDYSAARDLNPGIVYCSISGFGQDGPRSHLPAYDQILQGMGGIMSLTGPVDGPPSKLGIPIGDIAAGMFAAFAISSALFERERTGHGAYIDTSMLGGQVALLTFQAGRYFATGNAPGLGGNRHPSIAPYETFITSDGYVNVACGTERMWKQFCEAMGLDDLLTDERFTKNGDRVQNREPLSARIEALTRTLTTSEIVNRLEAVEVPCGPIYTLEGVFNDPQTEHLGLRQHFTHPKAGEFDTTGFPYRIQDKPLGVRYPSPLLGEHTEDILRDLGYNTWTIAELKEQGAI
ncbi:MAG: CaiB/BaiF CoA transferase family protein [Chloroflexota bacterium]